MTKSHSVRTHRARIISAAHDLFVLAGFRHTSVDDIAARACLSKRSIYANFSDKHDILKAVLNDFTDSNFSRISSDLAQSTASSSEKLQELALALQQAVLAPKSLAMARLRVAEAPYLANAIPQLSTNAFIEASELLRPLLIDLGTADVEDAVRMIYDLFVLAPLQRSLTGIPSPILDPAYACKIAHAD